MGKCCHAMVGWSCLVIERNCGGLRCRRQGHGFPVTLGEESGQIQGKDGLPLPTCNPEGLQYPCGHCVWPLGQNCSLHRTGRVGDRGTCAAAWSGKLLLPQLLHNFCVFPPRTGNFDLSCITSSYYIFCGWSTLSFLTIISFFVWISPYLDTM